MRHCTLALFVALTLGLSGAARAQSRAIVAPDGSVVVIEGFGFEAELSQPEAGAAEVEGEEKELEPTERSKKLKELEFDRRASAILAAWAKPEEPEPEPYVAPPAEEGEVGGEAGEEQTEAAGDASEPEQAEAAEGEAGAQEADEGEGQAEAEGAEEVEDAEAAAAEKAAEKAAKEAEKAAKKAAKEREKKEQEAREKAEAEHLAWELARFQRNVTIGDWETVASYLAGLEEVERIAGYEQLLASLAAGPKKKPSVPQQGRPYLEVNQFSSRDVLGLVAAAPVELEKEHLEQLGQILAQSTGAGHQIEAFLVLARHELAREEATLEQRALARMLVVAGEARFLGEFLPTREEAVAADDREGLNLLSRYLLAKHEEDKKTSWLEEAWQVNLAVLAAGEVDEDEKAEALQRAVDIAPKIREDLGQAWLDESFTERPERGMEVVAAIGAATSQALQSQPLDAELRLKQLELQTTAAQALLAAAPELADSWQQPLELLAANWQREADFSYQFDDSASSSSRMTRDPFGNFYYNSYASRRRGNLPAPIATAKVLDIRPGEAWLERVGATLRPRLLMTYAQLFLKAAKEAEAFPYIERVAADFPRQAKELVDEFLRVWATNHNPNESRDRGNQYIFFFGFEERAQGIPLTRSKQERNLAELAEWVARLRALPVEVDEELIANAFKTAHSSAEVFRLETIEQIFGPLEKLEPKTLAELVQTMRTNLVEVWRDPALQKEKKTSRRKKDIEAEVLRGYELAHVTLAGALADHPESWELRLAQAAIDHDENNYRAELGKDSAFSARRAAAFAGFREAAELYALAVEELEQDEEQTRVYELWFYAALGACDLRAVKPEMQLAAAEIDAITDALVALPGERAERHTAMFASKLFARMSNANPGVKFRYVREGLAITGDHELARDARQVLEYYEDLVTEIQLVARIDGSDRVGHGAPFGLAIDIRHTREIERESGGFGKYLQNQNAQNFSYNYGRPTEDYRDRFEEGLREALQEHFDVRSVTFNDPEAGSRADAQYGWRVTPYAYVLLSPRGPEVDRVPSLALDLDFLDTSGYAVLPIESAPVPIDASDAAGDERPFEALSLTQILDERRAEEGVLLLEVQAKARGLVPPLETILELAPEGFEVVSSEDQGVSVVQFDPEVDAVDSERIWTLTMQAREGLAERPTSFTFGAAKVETEEEQRFRYVDADLASVGPTIDLEAVYGEERSLLWVWVLALVVLVALVVYGVRSASRPQVEVEGPGRIPDPLTPFSLLGLLRGIESRDGLSSDQHGALEGEIARLERHFFGDEFEESEPDLRRIAEEWVARAE